MRRSDNDGDRITMGRCGICAGSVWVRRPGKKKENPGAQNGQLSPPGLYLIIF